MHPNSSFGQVQQTLHHEPKAPNQNSCRTLNKYSLILNWLREKSNFLIVCEPSPICGWWWLYMCVCFDQYEGISWILMVKRINVMVCNKEGNRVAIWHWLTVFLNQSWTTLRMTFLHIWSPYMYLEVFMKLECTKYAVICIKNYWM